MKLKLRGPDLPSVARAPRVAGPDAPRVAVIDDEPGNVAALVSLLQAEYQVEPFTDPKEALAAISRRPVDAVLTDQRMPGLLGTELLVELRERGHTPVSVIVTGYTDVNDLVLCINEGLLYRYVVKPWVAEDIRAALDHGVRSARRADALNRLVPRQVLSRLFPDGVERLALGRHQTLACAVMFADLRGFSSIAEGLSPADAWRVLAQYFELISPIIADHGGFIDKFLGDGVLGIFDAQDARAERVVACSRAIDEAVRAFAPRLGEASVRPGAWRVGVGVASGTVTLGTIGCPDRVEITVLGDTVNVAARLEETCKVLGATALIQASLAEGPSPDLRPLGLVPLRGKSHLVPVCELIDPERADLAPASELADVAALQQAGELSAALKMLTPIANRWPEDRVLRGLVALWRTRTRDAAA